MRIDWQQVVQHSPFRSLQTKATLLVIAIVAGVLALSTALNIRLSEHILERDLRDNTISLARQFAAGIGSWEELNDPAMLQIEIGQVMIAAQASRGWRFMLWLRGVPLSSLPAIMRSRPA